MLEINAFELVALNTHFMKREYLSQGVNINNRQSQDFKY